MKGVFCNIFPCSLVSLHTTALGSLCKSTKFIFFKKYGAFPFAKIPILCYNVYG